MCIRDSLNVSAAEKSTGKEDKITITNDKGRLSKEDIERMVEEAEQHKADDEAHREKVDARNGLEQMAYGAKENDKDAGPVTEKAKEIIAWLDETPDAEKGEYEAKQQELMQTLQQHAPTQPPSEPGKAPPFEEPEDGPKIEEVD